MKKKIGIFAGTFDPIHQGHIDFALHTLQQEELDSLYVIPEPSPRNKYDVTNIERRVDMAKLVFDDQPKITVWHTQYDHARMPETLDELDGGDAQLYVLLGSDVAFTLKTWPNLGDMIARSHLVIGVRNEQDKKRIHTLMAHLGIATSGYTVITTPSWNLSSSQVRTGKVSYHPKLQNYIQKHHLYSV